MFTVTEESGACDPAGIPVYDVQVSLGWAGGGRAMQIRGSVDTVDYHTVAALKKG